MPNSTPSSGSILLEALVGLFLFVTTMVAMLGLIATSFFLFADAQRGFLAARIAREGLEMALSKQQNHIVCQTSGACPITHWQENLLGELEVDAVESEKIDPNEQFPPFSDRRLCVLGASPTDEGKITQCSGAGSDVPLVGDIKRKVTIEALDSDRARVVVEVSWDRRRGGRASLILEGVFYGPV